MKKILFVCTGNIFRSLSAELSLKKYIKENKLQELKVKSAGIIAKKAKVNPITIKVLEDLGMEIKEHIPKKVTKEMLESADLVIAMAKVHKNFLKKNFNFNKSILFNQIAQDKETSIFDIYTKDNDPNKKTRDYKRIERTIKNINSQIPKVNEEINKYII